MRAASRLARWRFGNSTETIGNLRLVESRLIADVQQRAHGLQRSAITATALICALILLLTALIVVVLRPSIASLLRGRRKLQRA